MRPRPVPKFLCVKGILFFSFWQSVGISTLVATHLITRLGPYTEPENVSVGLNDILICMEMPFFAFAHMYAFSYKDVIDPTHTFVARMPMYYAFRDAFGLLDVIEDTKATLRGEGMDYREFEPAEGFMHQGAGRDRRIRAGLRYSKGGQRKYWLPKTTEETRPAGRTERVVNSAIKKVTGDREEDSVYAPLLEEDAENVVHLAPDMQDHSEDTIWSQGEDETDDGYGLPFGDLEDADEELFAHSKRYLFGDYNYPCIDVSSESARTVIWTEEERVLRDERGAWFSPLRGAKGQIAIQQRGRSAWEGYGAVGSSNARQTPTRLTPPDQFYGTRDGNIIDHEQERNVVPADPRDVHLHWTNNRARAGSKAQAAGHNGQVRNVQRASRYTPSPSPGGASPASGSGSASGSSPGLWHAELRVSPALSRRNSSAARGGSPVLPPDAVDLVVEDPGVAEEEQARERRKGEPTTRGSGLRKVYRRGFVHEGDHGEVEAGEVEVGDAGAGYDSTRLDLGERVAHTLEGDGDHGHGTLYGAAHSGYTAEWTHNVEGVIATSTTPPIHARLQTTPYDISDHENPWAS